MEQQAASGLPIRLMAELDRLGLEFMAGFLETDLTRHPANTDALAELGHVYTRLGRYEQGLKVDRELARRCPMNPTVHYNLGCSLALLGQRTEALDALEHSVELGYDDPEQMIGDEDLASVKEAARFRELVKRLEQAALDR